MPAAMAQMLTISDNYVPGTFRTPQWNVGVYHESHIKLFDRLTLTLGLRICLFTLLRFTACLKCLFDTLTIIISCGVSDVQSFVIYTNLTGNATIERLFPPPKSISSCFLLFMRSLLLSVLPQQVIRCIYLYNKVYQSSPFTIR